MEQADASRLQSAAVVILSDISTLPAGLSSALDKFVERGGGVLLTAGASNASSRTLPLSGWTAGESRYASRSGDRFFSVSQSDASSALIGLAAKWEGVRFFQIVPVQAKDATVLARLNDGTPVLLEQRRGEGRVLALASALDNLANDFPLHASFVPFIEQACRRLAQVESGQATLVVDSAAELRAAGSKAAVAVEVLDPKGRRVLDLKSATTAQSVPLTEEGFYEIGRQSGRRELIAVNADRAESNLEAAPQEAIDLWTKRQGSTPGAAAGPVRADEQRQSLWWYLAALLLAATLAESVYASRYLRPSQN